MTIMRALSISMDDDFELHLKRKPNSFFTNNYVNDGLKGWQTNMDIIQCFQSSGIHWTKYSKMDQVKFREDSL